MKTPINKVELTGNLGTNPEIISTTTGNKGAKFSIATNESYNNAKGEKITTTQWHRVVAWGKSADIVESSLKKGSQVYVEGKLTSRSYENKQGNTIYVTEIVVNNIEVLKNTDKE